MLLLRTLGELQLEGDDNSALSSRRKELLLLAYLARRTSRTASRAELAALLWHDRDDMRARQSLRQAVVELKRLLGEGMVFQADRIFLADNALILDADAFEGDLASGRLSEAVERWRGDFLAGTEGLGGEQFRSWLEAEREGLRRRLQSGLRRLVDSARQHGAWAEAITWAERWVEALPSDPDGFFHLVELLHLGGRTDEAQARHAVFLTRLRTELEIEPTAEFVRLGTRLERSAAALPSTATPGSSALFTPDLVQRGPALADLLAAWQRVRSGGVAVVLVEGEAGIGKTRLCDAFVRELEDDPSVLVLQVLGQGSEQGIELAAARALVTGLSRSPGLGGASASALSELAHISPAIRDRFPSLPEPAGGESQQVDALQEALLAVAEESPIVVYMDDFHLMDAQSQALIVRLISKVNSGVLFLLTARTGDEAWSPMLSRVTLHPGLGRLKLQALDANGVEALLGSMLQLPPPDRRLLAHRLHEHGGGNPFYIIELTSALVDEGLLLPTETGSWRLAALDGYSLPLPATVKEVIGRRLARLSPEARMTAEGAAVLGRTFDPELLPTAAGLTPATCAVAMEELVARKLVREAPLSPGMCEFSHDLICRVAYELLAAPRRETIHRAAARAWEGKARRNPAAQTALAYHRGRAGISVTAPWWKRGAVMAAGATALGIVLLVLSLVYQTRKASALVTDRVLVAPFENLTGDSRLDHLGTMAADWLTQGITDAAMMEVVDSRTAIMADRALAAQASGNGGGDRVRNLADETGARRVIWGSVYRKGDSIFFQTKISEAKTWQILRTMDPVGAPATDPARAIGVLRQRVVGALALMYNAKVSSWFAQAGRPPTYEAYQAFMEGADLHVQYKLVEAAEHYRRAFALDSTFVQPLLWAGDAYRQADSLAAADSVLRIAERLRNRLSPFDRHFLANQRGSLAGDYGAALAAAREMARIAPGSETLFLLGSEALGLNRPREALKAFAKVNSEHGFLKGWDGYWGWPMLAYHLLGKNDSALVVARRGRLQYPSSRQALLHEVLVLAAMGRVDDLEHLFDEAAGLPAQSSLPLGKILKGAAVELRGHGHTEASRRIAARAAAALSAADSSSEGDTNRRTLVEALYLCERWADAERIVAPMLRQHADDINWLGLHATVAARRGDYREALRVDSVLGADTHPYRYGQTALWRARIRAVVGDVDPAVSLLRSALARGLGLDFFLHANVDFEPLRANPEFRELLRPKG